MEADDLEYVGFWDRFWASLLDTFLIVIISWPLTAFYGDVYWKGEDSFKSPMDVLLSWVFPMVAIIGFWVAKQATPGKMAVSAKIVDAKTGEAPSTGQFIGRYLAYFLSGLPLGLGIFWVAFDSRKQGWHDKLAGTVVVRQKKREPRPVKFNKSR